jgi:hypothetical protein
MKPISPRDLVRRLDAYLELLGCARNTPAEDLVLPLEVSQERHLSS